MTYSSDSVTNYVCSFSPKVATAKNMMTRLRRSLPSVPDELVELHKDPKQYKRGKTSSA